MLAGCASQPPDNGPIAKVTITKIINKTTGEPVTASVITLRWEGPDGKTIRTEHYQNIDTLTTTLAADGQTRLWVRVEAPGYHTWEIAIRSKLNNNKPMTFPVELIPFGGHEQG
jgi:hypothetical protein